MELTFIGYIQIVLGGLIVAAGTMRQALLFLLISGLFNGSASLLLPALGGSSIPPIHFALAFVYLRIFMPGGRSIGHVPDAFRANRWLGLFAIYGIATAFILPRLFRGDFHVYPMKYVGAESLFETVPLLPTNQNITAAMYLVGVLLAAMAVWIACRRPGMGKTLVSALIAMAWIHMAIGVLAALARDTPVDAIFDLFRNSSYRQLDDDVRGFVRIRGTYSEASTYAAFGFSFFVANAELWYRSVRSRATGAAALAMFLVLFFSTSSTAYVGLAVYALFFALRLLLLPGLANTVKARAALAASGAMVLVAAIFAVLNPEMVESIIDVLKRMTVDKSDSDSSRQRLFWAMQGWDLFVGTGGLGVGAGSFRSSSMFLAILGSMGLIGIVSFLIYLWSVFQPWRRSTWGLARTQSDNIGAALGCAALLTLVPQAVNSATAVPGITFAILAAASLALRPFDVMRSAPVEESVEEELDRRAYEEIEAWTPRTIARR